MAPAFLSRRKNSRICGRGSRNTLGSKTRIDKKRSLNSACVAGASEKWGIEREVPFRIIGKKKGADQE